MPEHHIQKDILIKLVHAPTARYADLKPANIDGNVFTYHLQQLARAGLIEKTEKGYYRLTSAGKQAGISGNLSRQELQEQAHPILLLSVRDSDGRWLLRKRTVHPMYGRIGFIHGEPKVGENVADTAAQRFLDKTGLTATFSIAGSGFITLYQNEELESYTQFTLLRGVVSGGELKESDETGENFWVENPDFSQPEYIASMKYLSVQLDNNELFFAEIKYNL